MKKPFDATCEAYPLSQVSVGIETAAYYYEVLVRRCVAEGYIVRIFKMPSTIRWSSMDDVDGL